MIYFYFDIMFFFFFLTNNIIFFIGFKYYVNYISEIFNKFSIKIHFPTIIKEFILDGINYKMQILITKKNKTIIYLHLAGV
jgi:hypothetical protein